MELLNVSKKYGSNYVLKNASFDLKPGVTGLIGRNGAGKTTVMKIICEIIQKHEGQVHRGQDFTVGYLIEEPKLYRSKSGWYNIKYFSNVYKSSTDKAYIDYLVDALDMRGYLKRKVSKYSMGMRQKLGLVIAMLNKPKYLILDEPTNGMDPDGSIDVLHIIQEFSKKFDISVLISSHKLEDIEMIADDILFIEKGRLSEKVFINELKSGTYIELIFDGDKAQRAYEILSETVKGLEQKENVLRIPHNGDLSKYLERIAQSGLFPIDFNKKTTSLKDYYFRMIDQGEVR
ncbi:ABC transporter ATP-binding protein [Phocicoccus pinnipedialis]|uniref:Bacitracin transport ATP-binding protein BcrA n=1 Tax=Phocicoccus pinnipedialis TaxID=110845 RepID=A0A6V7RDX7_9BACL|nr:ABC transporter ATP-binding protein [Jeotgalicoccus pinnipedialis]MBP1939457.1 ABC-2 type transport system ATP-binding protein [Jeotgalicoccus pinnipedialis]CAD2075339.1 Bacitracin transport ATP-binding protein BcrA [Jeotgalicoccus pinnipedialis]